MHTTLGLVVLLLGAAVLATALFRALRLPALLGYVLVGVLIGQLGFTSSSEADETRHLAEFGVVFLMFSIGLEFSLGKLRHMQALVFGLGGMQVMLTILLVAALLMLVGQGWNTGLALGGALAMSSTAIIIKLLAERNELDSDHGRQVVGVLLFQDLAVVPLLIFIPALASGADLALALTLATFKAIIVLGVILVLGQRLLRPWLHLVAARKSAELFMLNVLLITLGLAWATGMAGLSLALGAFVAGMLISETEYRYQVESDIRPFRDVLMGLFFVTIGMSLDLAAVASQFGLTLLILVSLILFKLGIVALLAWYFSRHWTTALKSALGLAQAGEFGLVLLSLAIAHGLVPFELGQATLAAMVLSMLAAPFMVQYSDRVALRVAGGEWVEQAKGVHEIAVKSFGVEKHIIVCGFGRSGQNLSRLLEAEGVPFIALDHDPRRVQAAASAGEKVVFGDCTRSEVLLAAGLHRARAVVISFAHTHMAMEILHTVHELRPDMPVIVRTVDESDLEVLMRAGATEVVPEVLEGALMLGSQTLLMAGVPLATVLKRIRHMREARYSTMRGYYQGVTDADDGGRGQERLASFHLDAALTAVGKDLGQLELENTGVTVLAVRRRGVRTADPMPTTRLEAGDILILRGTPEALAAAELRLGLQ